MLETTRAKATADASGERANLKMRCFAMIVPSGYLNNDVIEFVALPRNDDPDAEDEDDAGDALVPMGAAPCVKELMAFEDEFCA